MSLIEHQFIDWRQSSGILITGLILVIKKYKKNFLFFLLQYVNQEESDKNNASRCKQACSWL